MRFAAAAIFVAATSATLRAQCDLQWTATGGVPGASGRIRAATLWDPDGAGPQPVQVVVGGEFSFLCDELASLVAMIDPVTGVCQPLPGITAGARITAVGALDNGDLVIGGFFAINGGNTVHDVARWNGSGWTSLGSGYDADVLLPQPGGELLIAENTLPPASNWVGRVRRWDGSSWTQVAPDVAGRIEAMLALPNGDLVVGGQFLEAGGVPADNVARWDGVAWTPLGAGTGPDLGGAVTSLARLHNGDLVAGGWLESADGQPANRIARWDGAAWSPLGAGVSAPAWPYVESLLVLANGDLLVGGTFDVVDGVPASCVARWNGSWSAVGGGVDRLVDAFVELPNGEVVAVGAFLEAEGAPAKSIARWDGGAWVPYGEPPVSDTPILVTVAAANGDLLIGGEFTTVGGVAANHVARRTSAGWIALGGGVSGSVSGVVRAMAELPNGDVVVGGTMTSAGGVSVSNIALWNGTSWSSLGGGTNGGVTSLAVMSDGALVAGGWFTTAGGVPASYVARWDGSTWSPLGSGPSVPVVSLAARSNGELVAVASFGIYQNELLLWDGGAWSTIASLQTQNVMAIQELPNGDLLFGGALVTVGGAYSPGLVRWHGGNSWSSMQLGANSSVRALDLLPNGDVVAVGNLTIGSSGASVARWDGAAWTPLAGRAYQIYSAAMLASGELAVAGDFSAIGGIVSPYLASLIAPCPATATSFGAGCVGSNGPEEMVVDALPWLGGTWRSRATGMPDLSIVATITGFTQLALPLSVLWSQAGAGCLGHTTADDLRVALPVAGEVSSQIAVPADPALIGAQLHQYALAFEFDAQGALLEVTSTNGVTVTLGRF
ncbi:MAG: hypothetical protein H6835_16995 [Planctomycetes bacterium]|nr:hypothetical protein [Planctomycetota bacterium]